MKCERCHSAEATKALSVELDGQPSTIFVCEDCARKEQSAGSPGPADGQGDEETSTGGMDIAAKSVRPPSLADMLLDMAKMVSAAQKDGKPPVFEVHVRDADGHEMHASSEDASPADPVPQCPVCHMTLDELRDGRRFGCPQCYETFREEVPTFTRELQFDDFHVGKAPARVVREAELHDLTLRLRKAVARQRFKDAKALSERIRELGGNPESGTGGTPDEEDEGR